MKKKYSLFLNIFIVSIFSFFLNTHIFSSEYEKIEDEAYACDLYYQSILDSDNNMARNFYGYYDYKGYGFWVKERYNSEEDKWGTDFIDGYLKIGSITTQIAASKVNIDDKILSINGVRPDENFDFVGLLLNSDIDKIKMVLLDENNEKYSVEIEKHNEEYGILDYSLREIFISDIDIKKGTYTARLEESYEFSFTDESNSSDKKHILNELAQNKLIYYDKGAERWTYHVCDPPDELFDNRTLQNPYNIKNIGLIKADKDYLNIRNRIIPFHTNLGNKNNEIIFQRTINRVLQIKNDFNLRSFPFDKQYIRYKIADKGFYHDTRLLENANFTNTALDRFMSIDDIPGWDKKSYKLSKFLYTEVAQVKGTAYDGISIEIELERKHGYYIYKVILPIILILSVCWSVVWVDPKELEARLTITIVCLLSLIAYNFVIDAELPKLEYLTVLDWIVLVSYVYATFPNFLSVISFRLHKTNYDAALRLETNCRKYGLLSYIISIFIIIWLNSLFNFENSSSLINWMAPIN